MMPDELRQDGQTKELRTIALKVEFLAGCEISEAAAELCELADRFGVLLEADFNGKRLLVRPGSDWRDLVAGYNSRLRPSEYRD